MGTSPDVGGSRGLGRPQIPEYQEQQQAAQVLNLKAGMGLVQSTLEIPLHQVGGEDRYKYQADSSRPNLDTKVLVATQSPEMSEKDPAEEAQYQEILDKLPLQLSLGLQDDQKKPLHERNPKFVVFEMILRFVAKALVWLERVSQIDSSQHSANIAKIQAFPHATLRGWIEVTENICDLLKSSPAPLFHTQQGMRDVKTNDMILRKFLFFAKASLKVKEDMREKLVKKFEKELMTIDQQVKKRKIRGVFKITENLLDKLRDLIGSMKVEDGATNFMGLLSISGAFFPEKRKNLCFGKTVKEILTLIAGSQKETTFFQRQFLVRIMGLVTLLFPTITLLAAGKKSLKAKKDPRLEKDNVQSLAIRLASCLIAHSQLIPIVTNHLLAVMEISEDSREPFVVATDVMAMNILLLNADTGRNDIKTPQPLMKGIKKVLVPRLEFLREVVGEHKRHALLKELNTGIRQASIALKRKENSWGYFEAIKRSLKPLKMKITDLREECVATTYDLSTLLSSIEDIKIQTDYMKIVVQSA